MKKSILFGISALVLGFSSVPAQAATVCNLYVNQPPTNVRSYPEKADNVVHIIKEATYITEINTEEDWTFAEVWVKDNTYVKGWIHNSQFTKDCYDQAEFSDAYWQYYDIADKAKTNGDYNTALINYNRAKDEYLRLNPDKSQADDSLEGLILLMEQKRHR